MEKRIRAIDLGRGFSVLLMMLVHTLWMYGDRQTQLHSSFGTLVHLVGRGTAMFLFAMGFSFVCSRSQDATSSAKRGLRILAVGYAMNALKFVVPIVVFDTMPESFIAAYGFSSPLSAAELFYLLRTGDILQLAGLSMVVIGLLRARIRDERAVLAIALGIAGMSGWVRGAKSGIASIDVVLDLFWGETYSVFFPFFPWFSIILVGMYFGMVYESQGRDRARLFARMLSVSAMLTLVGVALCAWDSRYHFNDFFHLGPGGALELAGIAGLLFWLTDRMQRVLDGPLLGTILAYASRHVTALYVIHWVLICWGMGIVGYQTQSTLGVLAITPLVVLATFGTHALIERLRDVLRSRERDEGASLAE